MKKTVLCRIKKLWVSVILLLIWITTFNWNMHVPDQILQTAETKSWKNSRIPETKDVFSGNGLLLFSYMRSGSTVTGNLLRDSAGVFYMFEPLSPLAPYHYFTDKSVCKMRTTECSSKDVKGRILEALLTLVNLYSCNMKAVPTPVLDKMVQENKSGKSWEEFGKCLNRTFSHEQQNGDHKRLECFGRLENACRAAEVRVAKVLRLSFTTVQTLLEQSPNLKILYLARDPRAIINSRIKTTWFPVFGEKPQTVLNNSLSLCLKMKTDIKAWKMVNNAYGDRILHTTLTKISSRINAILDIFKFINKTVSLTEQRIMISYLYKNMEQNITENWRTELSPSYKRHVEKHCGHVIQHILGINMAESVNM